MPVKAPRPCLQPGCDELVQSGRCERHRQQYQRRQDNPATAARERSFYWSQTWRRARAAFLDAHPLCAMCHAESVIRAAAEVDHIVSIRNGGDRFDSSNLQGLCKRHHSEKTLREQRERIKTGMGDK